MPSNMLINFLKPDIKGESADQNNRDAITVLSWSHSFNQPTSPLRTTRGGTVEQANHADFSFTKYLDAATPDLLKCCWSGRTFEKVVFTACRSDGDGKLQKYLEIIFSDVIITNLSTGGSTGDMPSETVTLGYGAVSYQYTRRNHDGGSQASPAVLHDLNRQMVS